MYYVYPAVFYPEGDGKFLVIFPDLNDLATCGDDLTEALAMAEDACGLYLFTALRDGDPIPEATPIEQVEKDDEKAFVNMVLVDLNEYAKKHSDKAVKKTLSIPTWLNTLCEKTILIFQRYCRMP